MNTAILEVTNGPLNWGKFLIGQFDHEWARPSRVDTDSARPLLSQRGWNTYHFLMLDIETGEGAVFRHGASAHATHDLNKHKIWVCPLFEPTLAWLYANWDGDIRTVPEHVDLPDAPFAMHGYRREGT